MKNAAGRIGFGLATVIVVLAFGTVAWFDIQPAHAATQASGYKEEVDRGGQVITTTTDPVYITVPQNARHAYITVKGSNPVCYGSNPTVAPNPSACSGTWNAACPDEWPVGSRTMLTNDRLQLAAIRVVSCSEGAGTVKLHYTGDRRIGD